MSMEDSQQQDCTVYIQQLKSDNPSLKLNAATKIAIIGAILGHNRIKDELIPYLIEIIQQMDNQNEFLIKVCDGILELKQFCKNSSELSSLIYPLKILASLDQPPVRDQAIGCLKKIAIGQGRQFYEEYYYPLIKAMSKKDGPFSPRIAACCLIPTTYPNLDEKHQIQLRNIFKGFALQDNSPLVRRAVAQNIQAFVPVVDKKIIRSDFLQIWQSLIVDSFDIIKIKALECAVIVARAFKKQQTTQKFFRLIKLVDSNKKSWRVRYAQVECLASILPNLQKDVVKKDVVEIFEDLLKDVEAEVRAIAFIKLPELTSKLSPQQNWNVFFQYIEKAAKDASKDSASTVKLALVEAIVPYFKSVDKQKVIELGIPILAGLLKEENQMIRIGVMQKIMQLNDIIGKDNTIKYLVPIIQGCILDKKWRFKLAISQNVISFFKILNYDEHKQFLQKVIFTFLKDHNYAVRQQTIKGISQLKQIIGAEKYLEMIQKYITLLINDSNYIYRITANVFLMNIKNLDKKEFSQIFTIILSKMQNEKISNVLVSLFVTFSKIKSNLTTPVKKQFQSIIDKIKENQQDQDVLYFLEKASE